MSTPADARRATRTGVWDDETGWADEWDEAGEEDDDRPFFGVVDLPPVLLPSLRELTQGARDSAAMAEVEALAERGLAEGVTITAEPLIESAAAGDPATMTTLTADLAAAARYRRRAVLELEARFLTALRAIEQLAGSIHRRPPDDDGAVLAAWAFVFVGWMDLVCPEPVDSDLAVEAAVSDVWVAAAMLLHQGRAVERSGFLRTVCLLMHEGRGRHHHACGPAQREVWQAARRWEVLGAATIDDDTVTLTDLGRYGVHRWVTGRGGTAPARLASSEVSTVSSSDRPGSDSRN